MYQETLYEEMTYLLDLFHWEFDKILGPCLKIMWEQHEMDKATDLELTLEF